MVVTRKINSRGGSGKSREIKLNGLRCWHWGISSPELIKNIRAIDAYSLYSVGIWWCGSIMADYTILGLVPLLMCDLINDHMAPRSTQLHKMDSSKRSGGKSGSWFHIAHIMLFDQRRSHQVIPKTCLWRTRTMLRPLFYKQILLKNGWWLHVVA